MNEFDSNLAAPGSISFRQSSPMSVAIKPMLDNAEAALESNADTAPAVIQTLSRHLRSLRKDSNENDWESIIDACRAHPLRQILHQDPLTARAYNKPRGYPGDADLLDIIYRKDYRDICPDDVTNVGEKLFQTTIECKAPSAVRWRRDFLCQQIDQLCHDNPSCCIFSVACGHLREAQMAQGIAAKSFGRFLGLDQDRNSIAEVAQTLGSIGVKTLAGSIKLLLSDKLASERFSLIYVAGLYDYLEERLAQRLTEKLFMMLEPEGRLLIANYMPDIEDVGYMEAYMDWRLIYRTHDKMHDLAACIPVERISQRKVYSDSLEAVCYLDIRTN